MLKDIAMERFINKKQSPQCQIETPIIIKHFWKTQARPADDFREAEQNSLFFLEPKIIEREKQDLKSFWLNDKNTPEMIRSREDLSGRGVNEISHKIMKKARDAGMKFMKLLIRACQKVDEC
jgi:hypothetical protein